MRVLASWQTAPGGVLQPPLQVGFTQTPFWQVCEPLQAAPATNW